MHKQWTLGATLLFFKCLVMKLFNRYQLSLLLNLLIFDRISFRTEMCFLAIEVARF